MADSGTLIPVCENGPETRIHRAGWVMADPDTLISNGYVRVENGVITETGVFSPHIHKSDRVVDHGQGLLMPALVNAHTHLELSAMKGKLSFEGGFASWVIHLMMLREEIGIAGLVEGMGSGVSELLNSGSLVVGDIATFGLVERNLKDSGLYGVLFTEYLGNAVPQLFQSNDQNPLILSVAGHAPHTTSPVLLKHLKDTCRTWKTPFSVHLAESSDEMEFVTTGKGMWADFLKDRGMDYSTWGLPFKSPVAYFDQRGLLDSGTLAVHLIKADKEDIRILKERNVPVCLCLRSNRNLHQSLPDVKTMVEAGLLLCLGTDSLASTESLSIWDEMRYAAHCFPVIPIREIVRMATVNGAKALGLGHRHGSLGPGKAAAMIYCDLSADSEPLLFENLLSMSP